MPSLARETLQRATCHTGCRSLQARPAAPYLRAQERCGGGCGGSGSRCTGGCWSLACGRVLFSSAGWGGGWRLAVGFEPHAGSGGGAFHIAS